VCVCNNKERWQSRSNMTLLNCRDACIVVDPSAAESSHRRQPKTGCAAAAEKKSARCRTSRNYQKFSAGRGGPNKFAWVSRWNKQILPLSLLVKNFENRSIFGEIADKSRRIIRPNLAWRQPCSRHHMAVKIDSVICRSWLFTFNSCRVHLQQFLRASAAMLMHVLDTPILSVCLSVRLSHAGIVSKLLNIDYCHAFFTTR